jgi:hypothetical protein
MNYSNLRTQILAAMNYPPKITAQALQEQLINIVNGLDLGALLLGVATPSLAPNTEANGFYFGLQPGTYTNFPTINGQTITVDSSEVAIIVRSGNYWSKIHITTYPTIDPTTKHWMIGNEDTGVLAEGTTPHIDQETGNWFIGTYDTGIHAQGAPGIPGSPGANAYVHIKYAEDASGTNMSDNPNNKDFIGILSNNNPTASSNAHDYTWAKFVGADGASAVNSFKGLFSSAPSLYASVQATAGDYAYVLNLNDSSASIYIYDSTASNTNYWSDSGKDVDLSSVSFNGGLSQNAKDLILSLFRKCAYVSNDAEDDIDDLEDEFTTNRELTSISANFNQGANVIYAGQSLNVLKPYLTVTAHYSDSSSETVNNYTLSGTLVVGTSQITVTYEGETAVFDVTVTAMPSVVSISAVYNGSAVPATTPLDNLKSDIVVTATLSDNNTRVLDDNEYTLSGTLPNLTVTYNGDSSITTSLYVPVSTALFTLADSDIVRNCALRPSYSDVKDSYHYATASSNIRAAYPKFDIPFVGNKTIKIKINSSLGDNIQPAILAYTSHAQGLYNSNSNFSPQTQQGTNPDYWDSGWLSLTNGECIVTIPEYAVTGNSESVTNWVARMQFRNTSSNSNFPSDFVMTSLEVEEVTNQ